ncbi:MAG: hypothetical protein IKU55_04140 [Clostridia bacterium]|nr:hypothetical protein [Clostridia bacterium]
MYDFKITDEPFATAYLNADTDSIYIATGKGDIAAAEAVRIVFDPETGFPSYDWGKISCRTTRERAQTPNLKLLAEKAAANPEYAADYEYIATHMAPFDIHGLMLASFSENETDIKESRTGWGGMCGGHAVPNLIDFARFGTDAMRAKIAAARANHPESDDFYEGLLLSLRSLEILAEKIAQAAQAEYERTQNAKLCKTMSAFSRGLRTPVESFAEAVSIYAAIFTLDGIDSPGRFDRYMIDFWKRSPYEESREALEDLWLFFHKTRTWNLCISGSDADWNDQTNALSYEILAVARKYRFQTPNITMRCHRNTPAELWQAAIETIATGIGMPALYSDEVVCPALERLGIPPADSHEYVMNGCNQIDIQGKSHMGLEDGEINLGLLLSYTLFGGRNILRNKIIGAVTPKAEELTTFAQFFDALKAQIRHAVDAVCNMADKTQRIEMERSANPIRSLTIEGCIERGRDYKNSGPLYGHGQVLLEGMPDCIDSLAIIKKFVYDEGIYTLAEVRDAIENDFVGYEEMHRAFTASGLNFGNDNAYVDDLAAELIDDCNRYLLTKETARGGFYAGGCSPFSRAADYGLATGALPNGKRKADHLFGDSIGATPGKDVNGPTALLNSCLRFDHTLPASGFILNLKFMKTLFDTPEGQAAFEILAKTYFERGGQQLSVAVVDREALIDALDHPEAHRDLIVRVGGFSAYFVELARALQENIIARTHY